MKPGVVTTLLQTSETSIGQPIEYPRNGTPEVIALHIEMAPGEETVWHSHPVPLLGYIFSGELTVYQASGGKRVVHSGEVSLEAVGPIHKGVNEGTERLAMIVFVLGLKGVPFRIDVASSQGNPLV